jgi:hypothetical protein
VTFVVVFNCDVAFDFDKGFDFTLDCDEVPVLVLFFCIFFVFSFTATVDFVFFFGVDDFDFDFDDGGLLRLRLRLRIPLLLQFFFVEVISGMAVKSANIVSSDDPSSWSSFFSSPKHRVVININTVIVVLPNGRKELSILFSVPRMITVVCNYNIRDEYIILFATILAIVATYRIRNDSISVKIAAIFIDIDIEIVINNAAATV